MGPQVLIFFQHLCGMAVQRDLPRVLGLCRTSLLTLTPCFFYAKLQSNRWHGLVNTDLPSLSLVGAEQDLPSTAIGTKQHVPSMLVADATHPNYTNGEPVPAIFSKWWALTKQLFHGKHYVWRHKGRDFLSPIRYGFMQWEKKIAELLFKNHTAMKCVETGDGSFIRQKHWQRVCKTMLSADFYDGNADVKMDLNLAPIQAPTEIRAVFGSMDIVVTHQVFEHLKNPVEGIANLNALLRQSGLLVFTAPFMVFDHGVPFDFHRYTTKAVGGLLTCGGFQVLEIKGLGSVLAVLASFSTIRASWMEEADLKMECSGAACNGRKYITVAALGKKTSDASLDDIKQCWGTVANSKYDRPSSLAADAKQDLPSISVDSIKNKFPSTPVERPRIDWWMLTTKLFHQNNFMSRKKGFNTLFHVIVNRWDEGIAKLFNRGPMAKQCVEIGDGSILRKEHWKTICPLGLTVDASDARADIKMDLNLAPKQAPAETKAAFGSMDIVVIHQVLVNLKVPMHGIANMNSLLRQGGFLVLTTPFMVFDHANTLDYFRYTVLTVEGLLKCGGFQVLETKGLGSVLTNIAFLAGIPASWMKEADLEMECSGKACSNKQYSVVAALGKKTGNVLLDDMKQCWG